MTPAEMDAVFLMQDFGCRRRMVGTLAAMSKLADRDAVVIRNVLDAVRAMASPQAALVLEHLGDLFDWLAQDEDETKISDAVEQLVLSLPSGGTAHD